MNIIFSILFADGQLLRLWKYGLHNKGDNGRVWDTEIKIKTEEY